MGGMLSKRYSEQSIDNLDRWIEIGAAGGTYSGKYVSQETALHLPAVWACFDLRTKAAGVLPGHVYRRRKDGTNDRELARDHYLYPLVHDRVNPWLTANLWRRLVVANLMGWGNHYSWIEWDRRPIPRAFWPLPPESVKVERKSATGPIQYFIRVGDTQTWKEFPAEDILHIRGMGDATVGWSPVRMMAETIGLGLARQDSASELLKNGVTQRLVLEYAGTANKDQMKILKDTLNESLKTSSKAIVLQAGFTAKPFSINPTDAQFLEQAKYTDSKIYQIYGAPPHMVGDTEKATSWGTGIEQQTIGFATYTVLPDMDLIETAIDAKLLPDQSEIFTEYELKGLLRGDTSARSAWYRAMIELGVMSPNGVLRAENEDPYQGGDVYRRPLNTAFVDKSGKVVQFTPPGAAPGGSPDEQAQNAAA